MENGDEISRLNTLIIWLVEHDLIRNKTDLARQIGYSSSAFTRIFKGETPISDKLLEALHKFCPNINTNWLRTGEGEMMNLAGYHPQDNNIRAVIASMNQCISMVQNVYNDARALDSRDENAMQRMTVIMESTNMVINSIAKSLGQLGLRVPMINVDIKNSVVVGNVKDLPEQGINEILDSFRSATKLSK